MKNLNFIMVTVALLFSSCAKDPCLDVTCLNDGQCDDGTCLCADWYEGADCGTEERVKYYGNYIGAMNFYDSNGDLIQSSQVSIPVAEGNSINSLDSEGLPFVLTVSGSGSFNIPITQINDPTVGNTFWQGFGSFNGNALTFNGTFDVQGETLSFTFSGTK